ncbi:hypothetical protein FQN54_003170 [Arachnomyces sp. PD_36]|nr:hypothetical protein FQN54_003170 [Arachnomyces sp. PD_36]
MTRLVQHVYRHLPRSQLLRSAPALNGNVLSLASRRTYTRHSSFLTTSSHAHFSPRASQTPSSSIAPFSTSGPLLKKKDKKSQDSSPSKSEPAAASGASGADDPFDFSSLQDGITDAVARLKDDLSKLRAGGRFNPETIEGLRVNIPKAGGGKEALRLGSLAQVIPKGGRAVTVLVGEEEHIKPITTTIQSSNLSLTPQPDPHNPLQLNVPIPPPTQESRDKAVQDARAAMDKAAAAVKAARATLQKRLRDMKLKKVVRPDDLKKAGDQMEKVAEKGQTEVKEVFEGVRKVLEQR